MQVRQSLCRRYKNKNLRKNSQTKIPLWSGYSSTVQNIVCCCKEVSNEKHWKNPTTAASDHPSSGSFRAQDCAGRWIPSPDVRNSWSYCWTKPGKKFSRRCPTPNRRRIISQPWKISFWVSGRAFESWPSAWTAAMAIRRS